MMNIATSALRWLALASCLALTLGCGSEGGGGSDDETNGGGGNGDTDTGLENATLELTADRPSVPSAGTEPVTITATVKDSNNVLREGVELAFSADSGSLSTGDQPTPTTDQAGRTSVELRAGSDPSPREITVRAAIVTPEDPAPFETEATDGTGSDSISLMVTGTTLTISGPDIIQSGAESEFTAVLLDSDGQGIPGRELTATLSDDESSLVSSTDETDSQGRQRFTVEGSDTVVEDTLIVQGLGQTASSGFNIQPNTLQFVEPDPGQQLPVDQSNPITAEFSGIDGPLDGRTLEFTISRGQFSNGSRTTTASTGGNGRATVQANSAGADAGAATVAVTAIDEGPGSGLTTDLNFDFIGTNPTNITVTTQDAEIAPETETTLEAIVVDGNQNPVAGKTVAFNIAQDPSQGSLSRNTAVTNSSGIAQTVFTAGANISGQEGVVITVEESESGIVDDTTLTVSGAALSVSLGTGNEILTPSNTEYGIPFAVAVTNSTGAPASDREVNIRVEPVWFRKGFYRAFGDTWVTLPRAGLSDDLEQPEGLDEGLFSGLILCEPEDDNNNNSLDAGEDDDEDGLLEPDSPTLSANTLTTGSDGRTEFDIVYPESEALWVRVKLIASVKNSAGTAFTDSIEVTLLALADDLQDTDIAPPGGIGESPYGTEFTLPAASLGGNEVSCSNPN